MALKTQPAKVVDLKSKRPLNVKFQFGKGDETSWLV
jgi:hypothetical protein